MKAVLSDENEMHYRIYEIPTSAILLNGKKIKYFDFISSLEYEACNNALLRIVPKIDLERIKRIIEETPFISELQKEFYITMLSKRKGLILDYAYNKLVRQF